MTDLNVYGPFISRKLAKSDLDVNAEALERAIAADKLIRFFRRVHRDHPNMDGSHGDELRRKNILKTVEEDADASAERSTNADKISKFLSDNPDRQPPADAQA